MKKLEKDTATWKARFENCNKALLDMIEEVSFYPLPQSYQKSHYNLLVQMMMFEHRLNFKGDVTHFNIVKMRSRVI